MLGTIVNTCAIAAGALIGSCLKKGINPAHKDALFQAMGFAAAALGINSVVSNLPKTEYPVLFIVSLAIGSLAGTVLDIDRRFNGLVGKFSDTGLAKGLSTAVLLFCIGTLSILGPVMSAVYGDNTFLFTNATLDFVSSIVFASTYGIGMTLAAPILFLWQGSIYLVSLFASESFFTPALVAELSITGGVLITASGISILGIKDCKTLNMLPALAVPILFFAGKALLGF